MCKVVRWLDAGSGCEVCGGRRQEEMSQCNASCNLQLPEQNRICLPVCMHHFIESVLYQIVVENLALVEKLTSHYIRKILIV